MISVYFSYDHLELSNDSRIVFSSTSKKATVRIGESVISMIDKIISNKYHYDYNNHLVRIFYGASAELRSLLSVYDVCTKDRLIRRIFYIVGFVADFFTTYHDYDYFVLTEEGDFKFTYSLIN